MSSQEIFDIVVIGAGPGGYAAAFRAADLGKKVVLIDRDKELGGVCLNRGCIPSKALLHISKVMKEVSELSGIGVSYGEPNINIDSVRSYKDKIISQLNTGISQLAKARGVTVVEGFAKLLSATEVEVQEKAQVRKIQFKSVLSPQDHLPL